MNDFKDRRDCKRCQSELPVRCGYFNSGYFYPAKISNHSDAGLCLDAGLYLKPGACVYYRIGDALEDEIKLRCCQCRAFRTVALAEVKWCHEKIDGGGTRYEAGLKYYPSVY
jgi:hypothetical protein